MRVYDYHSYTILNFKAGGAVLDYNNDDKRELHIQDTRREKEEEYLKYLRSCVVFHFLVLWTKILINCVNKTLN